MTDTVKDAAVVVTTTVKKMIGIASLSWGLFNPRLDRNLNIDIMVDDIVQSGRINEPIHVECMEDGTYQVLAGHRRSMAAVEIDAANAKFFPDREIEAVVHYDLTPMERALAIVDCGVTVALTDTHEVQRAANLLFEQNASEADVAISLAGLIQSLNKLNAKRQKELDVLEAGKAEAVSKGSDTLSGDFDRQIREFHLIARRGFIQGMSYLFRCPHIVMEARYFHATGKHENQGLFSPEDIVPVLTNAEVKALWKEFEKDLTVVNDGERTYSKERPGPAFNGKWVSLIAAQQKKAGEPEKVRPKSMSFKDITAEGDTYSSSFAALLCKKHAGGEVEGLLEKDKLMYIAELVFKHRPDVWELVEEAALAIKVQLHAEDMEAAQAAAESEEAAEAEIEIAPEVLTD